MLPGSKFSLNVDLIL